MKKIILPALVAVSALGLAACDGGEATTAAESETMAAEGEMAADPAMTEPVVEGDTSDSVTISEDGVVADINGSDTSVSANVGDEPSMTVETD